MNNTGFNIAAVERDTGLSKDVLRMWERRYGFPTPDRDSNGERSYPAAQVERLRLIKRLMDAGHRPGKLIATPPGELAELAPRRQHPIGTSGDVQADELDSLLTLIRQHDSTGFQQAMQQRLARQGLAHFVQNTVAPLTLRVGNSWEDGSLAVFEEHLFTELTKRLLRQAIISLPGGRQSPRTLLTSLPDEPHVIGLLMVEALFALEGAECIALGTQMPILEIGRAAEAHRADVVGLSFSSAFPQRQITPLLGQLRQVLPVGTELWAGGSGIGRLPPIDGVRLLGTLESALDALKAWQPAAA